MICYNLSTQRREAVIFGLDLQRVCGWCKQTDRGNEVVPEHIFLNQE